MNFTLKYAGPLLSQQSKGSIKSVKHSLRKHFHSQLAVLWERHESLKGTQPDDLQMATYDGAQWDVVRPIEGRGLFFRAEVGPFHFVPLVSRIHQLNCRLDIRLHRPMAVGGIVYDGGDLDNRLKVLFDSLQMPNRPDQLPSDASPEDGPSPVFHCLLENDSLITGLSVESFMLLDRDKQSSPNYVEMDIDVHIEPVTPMIANLNWLFR